MNVYGRAARVAVARLPDLGDGQRSEIAATLASLAAEAPRARWRELASVAWLSVRLRARADTGDRPEQAWRQGLHRGGTLLIAACAVDAGSAVATGLLVVGTWAAARGRAVVAGAAVLPALALVLSTAPDGLAPFVLRGVVGLAALAVSTTPARDAAALCPWRWMALAAVAVGVVTISDALTDAAVVALTLGLPLAWLLSSRADPRLAVGAAVALFWRLVAVDLHELADAAVALPTGPALDLLLVRWVAMAAGVAVAVVVARSTIRRASAI